VATEIRARLTLEDLASATLDKFKKQTREASGEAKKAEGSFTAWAKQTAAHFAAINLMPAIQQVRTYATEIVNAAAAEQQAITATAGLVSAVEGIPFGVARGQAEELDASLDQLGMNSGVKNLGEAFQTLLDKMGGTSANVDKARAQTEQLAQVSRVLGKDVQTIANEYGFMQEGVLRTKGQMFQLLQSTGIFGSETKKASAEWAKLTEDERMKRLDRGLASVAGRLSQVPPTFKQVTGQLEAMVDVAKETLGAPLIKAVQPELEKLIRAFKEAGPDLSGFAEDAGRELGGWVRTAGEMVRDGFSYIRTHGQEIKAAVVDAFTFAKVVVDSMVDNAKLIAGVWAAAKYGGAAAGVVKTAGIAGAAASQMRNAPDIAYGAMSQGGAGVVGAVQGVAALTLAIGGLALAADQAAKATVDYGNATDDQKSQTEQLKDLVAKGDIEAFNNLANSMDETSRAAEESMTYIEALIDSVTHFNGPGGMARETFDALTNAMRENMAAQIDLNAALANQLADDAAVDITLAAEAYNAAIANGNMAHAQFAANLLLQSGITAETLTEAGVALSGGFDTFNELFANASQGTLQQIQGFFTGKGAASVAKTSINMSGGQTFKINQEFRNADPDRMAVVFHRDMVRAATSRVQAQTSGAFGT
jgi:hypothetical protein